MTVGELFAGIGGIGFGLEQVGMEVKWQVEKNEFCRKVLAKHWPDVTRYGDIEGVGAHNLEPVDLICGGFPCQPVSLAGNQKAQDDERWLWPEFGRIIRDLRPQYVLVENVPGLLVRGFGDVLGDLAALGYDAEWGCVSAASVGAPHLRRRVFIVAHAQEQPKRPGLRESEQGRQRGRRPSNSGGEVPDPERDPARLRDDGDTEKVGHGPRTRSRSRRNADVHTPRSSGGWAVEPDVGRVAYGVPSRVDRLRGLGNAIVPQVAEYVGRQILSSIGEEYP